MIASRWFSVAGAFLLVAACSSSSTRPASIAGKTIEPLPVVAGSTGRIEVHVTGIPAVEGKLLIVLYDERTYLKEGEVAKSGTTVSGSDMRVSLDRVPAGRYLIVATHDANGNDKLDTNLLGLPSEAYGFSRDARGSFGPPSFDDAAFDFDGKPISLEIELH